MPDCATLMDVFSAASEGGWVYAKESTEGLLVLSKAFFYEQGYSIVKIAFSHVTGTDLWCQAATGKTL